MLPIHDSSLPSDPSLRPVGPPKARYGEYKGAALRDLREPMDRALCVARPTTESARGIFAILWSSGHSHSLPMQKRATSRAAQELVPVAEPVIETERLVVRLARTDDVPAIVEYWTSNRRFLSPWEPIRTASFYTDSFWTNQVARSRSEWEQGKSMRLILVPRSGSGEVIGVANFTEIVRGVLQACFLGYSLSESAQGQGYMYEALHSAVSVVFGELALHRIQANYMPHNVRSARLLRRLGFNVEGYARDYLRIGGKWEDHVLTSLTNPDWQASS